MTGTLALGTVPAQAHDALVGSEPADGAVLTAAPTQVVLTFASAQAEIGAEVVITGPDGAAWADGPAVIAGATVTQRLRDGLPNGSYLVQWRSVAGDGHPVDGTLSFDLELPIEPTTEPTGLDDPVVVTPTPTEPPVVRANVGVDLEDDSASPVPWIAGGALLVVVGGFTLAWATRRRST